MIFYWVGTQTSPSSLFWWNDAGSGILPTSLRLHPGVPGEAIVLSERTPKPAGGATLSKNHPIVGYVTFDLT